ncbi:hypothetical protein [Acidianus sp. HS-5]|uniref:hypothetical protein n=1 Tax=Acidianus sp. HS-5 TaxID=2886040 RepID=UPI001F161EBE|nr:hypothetical protein [Acidianus sp. HS-5]BDC18389.1 hypothetical protein HS5_12790 [Acidianus sp. HS-5]
MKVLLGIPDERIPIWELGTPLMINQLVWNDIPWSNETWVDSGGYQIMVKGFSLNIDAVLKKYLSLKADNFMSLDIPSFCTDVNEINFKNFEYLYSKVNVMPIIHAYTPDGIEKAVEFYSQYTDKIAYGGIVPPSLKGSKKLVIMIYHYLRRKVKYLHVLGAGSPYMRELFFNADSVDTATYRIKASMGLVIIPGKGERYVGDRKIVWKAKRATTDDIKLLLDFLEKTKFPYKIDLQNWISRAIINAWILVNSKYDEHNYLIDFSRKINKMGSDYLKGEIEEICNAMSTSFGSSNN